MGKVLSSQQCNDLLGGHRLFGRHQLGALFVERGVERDGHMAFALLEKALQFPWNAHRAHRDPLGAPTPSPGSGQNLRGTEHGVQVIHRFALSHEHDVGESVGLRQGVYLVQDIASREVSFKSLFASLAKETVHFAPHLR